MVFVWMFILRSKQTNVHLISCSLLLVCSSLMVKFKICRLCVRYSNQTLCSLIKRVRAELITYTYREKGCTWFETYENVCGGETHAEPPKLICYT